MLFLSPTQKKIVRRYHASVARIRGAAVLGRRYPGQRILVATFSRPLCVHMKVLFQRLTDARDAVDFFNIDQLAARILGDCATIGLALVDPAFDRTYRQTVLRSVGAPSSSSTVSWTTRSNPSTA